MLTLMETMKLGETVKTIAVEQGSKTVPQEIDQAFEVLLALRATMHDIVLENMCGDGEEIVRAEAECVYTYITAVMDMRTQNIWRNI